MSARKATKPAAKKSTASKAIPTHPTWADMIKVSLPFTVTPIILYSAIYSSYGPIVVVVCRNWQGKGNASVRKSLSSFFFVHRKSLLKDSYSRRRFIYSECYANNACTSCRNASPSTLKMLASVSHAHRSRSKLHEHMISMTRSYAYTS